MEAEAKISDVTASANLSRLPIEPKYAGLQEPVAGIMLPRLVLSIQETVGMDPAAVYEIMPAGLKGGKHWGGGVAYAGTNSESDILLAPTERGVGAHHFQISYHSLTQVYRLKDLGEGTGTFIKLTYAHLITNPCVISYGEIHMKVTSPDNSELEVGFLEGQKKDTTL